MIPLFQKNLKALCKGLFLQNYNFYKPSYLSNFVTINQLLRHKPFFNFYELNFSSMMINPCDFCGLK